MEEGEIGRTDSHLKTKQMQIIEVKVSDLKPYKENAKKHPKKQIDLLKANITKFGFTTPVLIDKNNSVIAGHGRLLAMKELGKESVPCVMMGDLTEEEVKALRLADNRIAEMGEWDMDLVIAELKDISAPLLDLTGFSSDLIITPEEADDEVPEVPQEPQSVLGDLYELGEHRVMCGDSTNSDYVADLMDGKRADIVFTDPPYRLDTKGGHKSDISKQLIKQGNAIEFISDFEPAEFLNVLPTIFRSNCINAYIFCNKELLPDYLVWAKGAGYSFNVLVWKKPTAIPIGDSHRPDIEYLLLFRKNAIWNNGLSNIVNYSRLIESPRESGLHPTMKPVNIITNQLLISSHE